MCQTSLCPSSGEQDRLLPHMVFCTGCAGCGCVELRRELCALCESNCYAALLLLFDFRTVHSLRPGSTKPQPVQNTICGSTQSCSPDDGHNDV